MISRPACFPRYARRHDGDRPNAAAQLDAHAASGPLPGDALLTRHAS
ncbi:hypothetical protein P355_5230 [Burkholderia cenocepacia KC-01]|nr:hypothetical protein P355_5230 [Burkholderia cenocepacia KC-01]